MALRNGHRESIFHSEGRAGAATAKSLQDNHIQTPAVTTAGVLPRKCCGNAADVWGVTRVSREAVAGPRTRREECARR